MAVQTYEGNQLCHSQEAYRIGVAGRLVPAGEPARFMARKLKTFQTSLGFYDLAIAVPSMKVALEAWDAGRNLFHQGVAKETDDQDVVAATMSKPGIVLKRPAGSSGRFAEYSDLPSDLGSVGKGGRRESHRAKPAKRPPREISEQDAQKPAAEFEKEQKRHETERRREEAARERDRERREKATAKAQTELDKAEREHAKEGGEYSGRGRGSREVLARRGTLGKGTRAAAGCAPSRAGLGPRQDRQVMAFRRHRTRT